MAALAGTCFYVISSILHCLPQPKQGAFSTLQLWVAHSACSIYSIVVYMTITEGKSFSTSKDKAVIKFHRKCTLLFLL